MNKHLDELRALHGAPSERVVNKVLPYMNEQVQEFIRQSPFAVLATSNAAGDCDASPRGGLPGFVRILDEKTLLLPDIKGNRMFQSFENILGNPKAGLLFLLPGNNRCARVNGRVRILQKRELDVLLPHAEVFEADENTILIQALVMEIDEAYIHCPRALQFSALWQTENK
jgi:PPOX class probable FMN-dependent enzyme